MLMQNVFKIFALLGTLTAPAWAADDDINVKVNDGTEKDAAFYPVGISPPAGAPKIKVQRSGLPRSLKVVIDATDPTATGVRAVGDANQEYRWKQVDSTPPVCTITGGPTPSPAYVTSTSTAVSYNCTDAALAYVGFPGAKPSPAYLNAECSCTKAGLPANCSTMTGAGGWAACSPLPAHNYLGAGGSVAIATPDQAAYQFSVRTYDTAGTVSNIATRDWRNDLENPTMVGSPSVNCANPSGATTITFSPGTDTASGVSGYLCQMDNATPSGSTANCSSPWSPTVSAGGHTAYVFPIDNVGRVGSPASASWVLGGTGSWGGWYDITGCSAACGTGTKTQQRDYSCPVSASPGCGGCTATAPQTQVVACNLGACSPTPPPGCACTPNTTYTQILPYSSTSGGAMFACTSTFATYTPLRAFRTLNSWGAGSGNVTTTAPPGGMMCGLIARAAGQRCYTMPVDVSDPSCNTTNMPAGISYSTGISWKGTSGADGTCASNSLRWRINDPSCGGGGCVAWNRNSSGEYADAGIEWQVSCKNY